jgi:hypothetical protein
MRTHRVFTDKQRAGNIQVGRAAAQFIEDFTFTLGQRRVLRGADAWSAAYIAGCITLNSAVCSPFSTALTPSIKRDSSSSWRKTPYSAATAPFRKAHTFVRY